MYDSTPALFGHITRKSHRRSPARADDERYVDNSTAAWPPAVGSATSPLCHKQREGSVNSLLENASPSISGHGAMHLDT